MPRFAREVKHLPPSAVLGAARLRAPVPPGVVLVAPLLRAPRVAPGHSFEGKSVGSGQAWIRSEAVVSQRKVEEWSS